MLGLEEVGYIHLTQAQLCTPLVITKSSETSGLPSTLNTTNEHLNDCEPEVEEAIHFTNEQNQDQSLSEVHKFSPEQEQLFQRRYEENYNIPDMLYLQWLKKIP